MRHMIEIAVTMFHRYYETLINNYISLHTAYRKREN